MPPKQPPRWERIAELQCSLMGAAPGEPGTGGGRRSSLTLTQKPLPEHSFALTPLAMLLHSPCAPCAQVQITAQAPRLQGISALCFHPMVTGVVLKPLVDVGGIINLS